MDHKYRDFAWGGYVTLEHAVLQMLNDPRTISETHLKGIGNQILKVCTLKCPDTKKLPEGNLPLELYKLAKEYLKPLPVNKVISINKRDSAIIVRKEHLKKLTEGLRDKLKGYALTGEL